MSEQHSCSVKVYGGGSFTGHPCSKKASVERDGKWYCGTHDPVKVKQRDADRSAKWNAEYKAQADIRHRAKLRAEAGEMGIELAKFILSPGGNSLMELCQMAHAVIDKVGEK